MDPLASHARAQEVFGRVLDQVIPQQYGEATPCEGWTVRDLIEHVVGGNNRTAAGHPGRPIGQPEMDGIVEGGNVVELFAASAERAQSVFAAPDGLTRTFEMPFGALPGSRVIGMRTTELLVHAWDLAVATGQDTDLEPELAQSCLEAARERLQDSLRGPDRPFGPEQHCPPGRPAADQLAAFMGRRVPGR